MSLKQIVATITALSVILGAAFAVDGRYFRTAAAGELKEQIQQEQKASNVELRLEILREKLARLNAKPKLSADEEDERKFTRELIAKLQGEALKK